jgi:RNA polymerase-binding transcription factor DksA
MGVPKGDQCENCLGIEGINPNSMKFEDLTSSQKNIVVEWLLSSSETALLEWGKKPKPLGPMASQVLETTKRHAWSPRKRKVLERKLAGIDEKSPLGQSILQTTMSNLTSDSLYALGDAVRKESDLKLTAPQRRLFNEEMLIENVAQAASAVLVGLLKGAEGVGRGVGALGQGAGEAGLGAGEAVRGAGEAVRNAAPGVGSGAGEFARGAGDAGFGVGTAVRGFGEAVYNIMRSIGKRIGVTFYNDDVERIKNVIKAQKLKDRYGVDKDKMSHKQAQVRIQRELELVIQQKEAEKKLSKNMGTTINCKICDEPIPQARLEAIPNVQTCVVHSDEKPKQ